MATALENGIDWGTQLNPVNGVVTYYFYPDGVSTPSFGSNQGPYTSSGFTDYEKGQFVQAFALYSNFLNLTFTEVNDPNAADLKLVTLASASFLGEMYPPGYTDQAGYGYFNVGDFKLDERPQPGRRRLRHDHPRARPRARACPPA